MNPYRALVLFTLLTQSHLANAFLIDLERDKIDIGDMVTVRSYSNPFDSRAFFQDEFEAFKKENAELQNFLNRPGQATWSLISSDHQYTVLQQALTNGVLPTYKGQPNPPATYQSFAMSEFRKLNEAIQVQIASETFTKFFNYPFLFGDVSRLQLLELYRFGKPALRHSSVNGPDSGLCDFVDNIKTGSEMLSNPRLWQQGMVGLLTEEQSRNAKLKFAQNYQKQLELLTYIVKAERIGMNHCAESNARLDHHIGALQKKIEQQIIEVTNTSVAQVATQIQTANQLVTSSPQRPIICSQVELLELIRQQTKAIEAQEKIQMKSRSMKMAHFFVAESNACRLNGILQKDQSLSWNLNLIGGFVGAPTGKYKFKTAEDFLDQYVAKNTSATLSSVALKTPTRLKNSAHAFVHDQAAK